MKQKIILLPLFTAFLVNCHSQGFIGKSYTEVNKLLQSEKNKPGNPFAVITASDSSIVYSVRDDKMKPADFIYSFNQESKCIREKVVASCDSCFQKYLSGVLSKKKYRWQKINENQYVSKYSSRLLLEIPPENTEHSYMILRTGWKKKQYKLLTR